MAKKNKTEVKAELAKAKAEAKKSKKAKTKASKKNLSCDVPDAKYALEVRASEVHGKGVFAKENIPKKKKLLRYKGEMISWKEADRRHPHDPEDPNHTFYFALESGKVIDGGVRGNDARWINHSCAPNCEAVEDEEKNRVYIYTVRKIRAGEELTYDYGLVMDGKITKKEKAAYVCRCGSKKCRGTMLALPDSPPSSAKQKRKDKKRKK